MFRWGVVFVEGAREGVAGTEIVVVFGELLDHDMLDESVRVRFDEAICRVIESEVVHKEGGNWCGWRR